MRTAHKYGAVLSGVNKQEITDAVTALIRVLSRAGIVIGGTMDEKAIEEKLKQLDPESAQQIAELVNNFVQTLDTELGITEAVQGQQEQPVDEDGNPIEEEKPVDEDGNPVEEKPEDEPPPEEEIDPATGQPKKKPPVKSKAYWLEQSEVNYNPDATGDKHCSSCRWFIPMGEFGAPSCTIVATWPAPIVANGVCDRHEPPPTYEPEPLQVEVVAGAASVDSEKAQPSGLSFVQTLKATVNRAIARREPKDGGNFQVFKGTDGKYYWLARHTNNFEDRDKEILSGKSHDAYAARVGMGLVDKPELWVWHSKGSGLGIGDQIWTHRLKEYPDVCFVFALGHFENDPISQRAAKYLEKNADKVELSHGFTYPSWALKNGVYETYNTFEISVLPKGMAANPYTSFEEIEAMALTDKQRQWIKETGGDALLARVERSQAEAEKDGETLKALDKRYKDFGDAIAEKDDEITVDLKKVLKVVSDLIDAQGQLEAGVTEATKEASAQKAAREDLQVKVEALEAQLKLVPRSAAIAKQTEIEGGSALAEALKKVNQDDYDVDPVWGKLKPKA